MKTMVKIKNGLPMITIVGCPNVGKSSLFNRIVKSRTAIVYQEVGTTRDRISQESEFKNKTFILTDTGGYLPQERDKLLKMVKEQIKKAISDSDILLFVCDGQAGLSPQDFEFADILRKVNKPIFLVINKIDNEKLQERVLDFYQLGLGKPYSASALHNSGIYELMNDVVKDFPEAAREEIKTDAIKVAIVGRPNVGKSSFLNYLLKEERMIVDNVPGTTRDTTDTYLKDGETEFLLIDTAGLKHKRKVKEAVDVYSMMRTKEAIKRSEICLVLIDGYQGIITDDMKILDLVLREGKCCIVCVNKWDLVKEVPVDKYKDMIYNRAVFLKRYPILFTSSKTGYNVYRSLGLIKEIIRNSGTQLPTHQLNKLLSAIKSKGPFAPKGNDAKIQYITQMHTRPPVFLIFINNPLNINESHKNFIENSIRKTFNFFGVTIKIDFRGSKETKRR